MFCRKCGNKVADDAKFCIRCGTKLLERINVPINQYDENDSEELVDDPEPEESNNKFRKNVMLLFLMELFVAISPSFKTYTIDILHMFSGEITSFEIIKLMYEIKKRTGNEKGINIAFTADILLVIGYLFMALQLFQIYLRDDGDYAKMWRMFSFSTLCFFIANIINRICITNAFDLIIGSNYIITKVHPVFYVVEIIDASIWLYSYKQLNGSA